MYRRALDMRIRAPAPPGHASAGGWEGGPGGECRAAPVRGLLDFEPRVIAVTVPLSDVTIIAITFAVLVVVLIGLLIWVTYGRLSGRVRSQDRHLRPSSSHTAVRKR